MTSEHTVGNGGRVSISSSVRRLAWTLLLGATLVLAALWIGSARGELPIERVNELGFGLDALRAGRIDKLFSATFLVRGPTMLAQVLFLVAWSVGVLEWRSGMWRALCVFWIVNVAASLATLLLVVAPLAAAGVPAAVAWSHESDLGPSAGCYGCAGAWVQSLPPRARHVAWIALVAILVVKQFVDPVPLDEVTHVLSFLLGTVLEKRSQPRRANA